MVLPKGVTEHAWPSIFGWSGGYVALAFDGSDDGYAGPTHLISASSRDGIHWTKARTAPMPASLPHEPELGYQDVYMRSVLEGPGGLLAVGSDSGGTCGGPSTDDALWTSRDGVTWRPVTLPRAWMDSTIWSIAGGSTGFIAGGYAADGVTQSLWLSRNGRSWHRTRLPQSAGSKSAIDEVASFAAGYVVVGTVMDDDGCGGPWPVTATIWWSPTGRWWARIPLGGPFLRRDISVSIVRVSDRKLIAVVNDPSGPDQAWMSTTGRRWTRIPLASVPSVDGWIAGRPVSIWFPGEDGKARVTVIEGAHVQRALPQRGPGPIAKADDYDFPRLAAGPTGVLVVNSDKVVWLGVPTTR
jgi:hypothetical protein